MSETLVPVSPSPLLPIPWRDPHTVPPGELSSHIQTLERACLERPESSDLRTVLGIAHAMNYDVYKSMDALEAAIAIEPSNFWAQLKYGELLYRLRALTRAEAETSKALELAGSGWQLSLARKQLQEVRRLSWDTTRNVTWDKPLAWPALTLTLGVLIMFAVMLWK